METHSEHIVRGIQVLVAQGKVPAEDIAIYYVSKNDDGTSKIEVMDLEDRGFFTKEWPAGFMDLTYKATEKLLFPERSI